MAATEDDMLAIWTVCVNTTDYPGKFVARAHYVGDGTSVGLRVLQADTLAGLRKLLPPGLVMMPRLPDDDPVIVETWM